MNNDQTITVTYPDLNTDKETAMTIRPMQITDYEQVHGLWMSCPGMGLNNLDDSREGIEKFLRRNLDTCFVAECGGRVAGVILAGHDGRRGYIYHTAVGLAYRKQGIGCSLVNAALQALRMNGINKVALVVFDRNDTGNTFWEKMGFTVRQDLVYRNRALTEIVRMDT